MLVNMENKSPLSEVVASPSNSLTCHHLLSLIDQGCHMIRCLGHLISDEVATKKLEEVDQGMENTLKEFRKHFQISHSVKAGYADLKEIDLWSSCWDLCSYFFGKPALLVELSDCWGGQPSDLSSFYKALQKVRDVALKRFSASLEEESAIEAYLNEIFLREEKAIRDRVSLEQQLQLERNERSMAYAQFQESEHFLNEEREQIKADALAAEQHVENEFFAAEDEQLQYHSEEESKLLKEISDLKSALESLQIDNREMELGLFRKKGQSVEEVIVLMHEYEQDIKDRAEELKKLHEEHNIMNKNLECYQTYFKEKEDMENKKIQEERRKSELKARKEKQKEDAVLTIQYMWRRHAKKKKAQAHAKKDKNKGKKGNKGKTKK